MSGEAEIQLALSADVLDRLADLVADRLAARVPRESPWLNAEHAAAYLDVTLKRVRNLTAAGAIPCHRLDGGRRVSYHRDDLDQWLRAHRHGRSWL